MAKKITGYIKLQVPAGKQTVTANRTNLGQHGVNIWSSAKRSTKTQADESTITPVVVTVYADRSFTLLQRRPCSVLIENGQYQWVCCSQQDQVGSLTKIRCGAQRRCLTLMQQV
jgi:large subunit ribosomal protein L11